MPLWLVTFAGSKLGKGVMIFLAIVAILGAAFGAKTLYDNSVRRDQMLKDQNAQLIQVIKDNNAFMKKTEELAKTNTEVLEQARQANEKVGEHHTEVKKYIQSPAAQASNRESSDVLKNTIRMLNNED